MTETFSLSRGDLHVGDLYAIAVRSPSTATSVTVMINPNVTEFQQNMPGPPGVEIERFIALSNTEDTASGIISIGAVRSFFVEGREYRLSLESVTGGLRGPASDSYHFLIDDQKGSRWADLVKAHEAAVRAKDNATVASTASEMADLYRAGLFESRKEARLLGMALFNKGVALIELGNNEAGREVLAEVIAGFNVPDPILQERRGWSLYRRGLTYVADGQHDKAVADFAELDRAYGSPTAAAGQAQIVAQGLLSLALSLFALGRRDEARRATERVIERYGARTESQVADRVQEAKTLLAELRD